MKLKLHLTFKTQHFRFLTNLYKEQNVLKQTMQRANDQKCAIIPFVNEQNWHILHLMTFALESKDGCEIFHNMPFYVLFRFCLPLSAARHLHKIVWLVGGVGAILLPIYRSFSHKNQQKCTDSLGKLTSLSDAIIIIIRDSFLFFFKH